MKEKRIEHLAAVKHSFEESRWVLDTMKIKAIGFLLDENLTILWASNPFYEKAGYTKEEFHSQYQNLRQYYIGYPNELRYIESQLKKDEKGEAASNGEGWLRRLTEPARTDRRNAALTMRIPKPDYSPVQILTVI